MPPARKMTSYYGKRKRAFAPAKTIVKRRRTFTPSNVNASVMNVPMAYRGMLIIDFGVTSCVDTKVTLGSLFSAEQTSLAGAFAQSKLKYVVFKVHSIAIASGTPTTVGCIGGAVLDTNTPTPCSDLNTLVNQAPACKPMGCGALNFDGKTIDYLFKPITTAENTWLDTQAFLAKQFGVFRLAHNGQVTNNSSVAVEYYVKIQHKRN